MYSKLGAGAWVESGSHTGTSLSGFGYSVAVSGNGNLIAVGAPGLTYGGNANAGEVQVIENGQFTSVGGGTSPGETCGTSIAFSGDGKTVVMGCAEGSSAYAIDNGGGLVWNNPVSLAPLATLETGGRFGSSVAVSKDGSKIIVGGPDSITGEAYLFTRAGTYWRDSTPSSIILKPLVSPPLASGIRFGSAVGISGDGTRIAVGSNRASADVGSVFVFTANTGTTWDYNGQLLAVSPTKYLGDSVGVSGNGQVIVAGATNTNGGEAFAYDILIDPAI